MKKFALIIYLCITTVCLYAVPAKKGVIKVPTADGDTIEILLYGDENHSFVTTTDGYLIKMGNDGNYYYAKVKNSVVEPTSLKVTNVWQRTADVTLQLEKIGKCDLQQMTSIAKSKQKAKLKSFPSKAKKAGVKTSSNKVQAETGSKGLVILVSYSDLDFTNSKEDISDLLNKKGYNYNGATGSAKDYFESVSSGKYSPQFDVYGPYKLDNKREYYGGNNYSGDDQNPAQMVVDACAKLAADKTANIDFSDYDTDNDGYVDNIFIYYAGNNEAEGGPENSVWPHRWCVYPGYVNGQTTYNGVTIFDYACTSEFRGSYGKTRCGIGTFTHEFSHVLGLPDLYITDYGSNHKTLGSFDLMDAGSYNNNGNTPPSYSAYERFYVGWLKPTILNSGDSYKLGELQSTNKAYLISSTGKHNLDGQDPNPTTFFLLENRQQTEWDKYLVAHGMMITKIKYDAYNWQSNVVNNSSNNMGVDIMEAGGNFGYEAASDLFPGAYSVISYTPYNNYPITNIKENNSTITFDFMGGKQCPFTVMFFSGNYGYCDSLKLTENSCDAGIILPDVTTSSNDIVFVGWSTEINSKNADAGAPGETYYPDGESFLYAIYTKNGEYLDIEESMCFSESFNKMTAESYNEISANLDNFTDLKNWKGNKIYCYNGSIKVGNNAEKGELETPVLPVNYDLQLYIKGHSTLQSELTIYNSDDKIVGKIALSTEEEELITTIKYIPLHSRLRFENSQNVFFIDSISVCGAIETEEPVITEAETIQNDRRKVQLYKTKGSTQALLTNVPLNAEVVCYDIVGHKLWQQRSMSSSMTIEVPQGMFIIQIIKEDSIETIKGI